MLRNQKGPRRELLRHSATHLAAQVGQRQNAQGSRRDEKIYRAKRRDHQGTPTKSQRRKREKPIGMFCHQKIHQKLQQAN